MCADRMMSFGTSSDPQLGQIRNASLWVISPTSDIGGFCFAERRIPAGELGTLIIQLLSDPFVVALSALQAYPSTIDAVPTDDEYWGVERVTVRTLHLGLFHLADLSME